MELLEGREPFEQLGPMGPFILGPLILVGTEPIGPFMGPFIEFEPIGLCIGGPIGLFPMCPPGTEPIVFMGLPMGPEDMGEPIGKEFIGLIGLPIDLDPGPILGPKL